MFVYRTDRPLAVVKVKNRAETRSGRLVAAYHAAVSALDAAADAVVALPENAKPATRSKATEAVAVASAALDVAANAARASFKFTPAEGSKVFRFRLTPERYAQWCAESDAEKRTAILGDVADAIVTESPIHPTIAAYAGYRESVIARTPEGMLPSAFALSELTSGTLVLPSRGKGPSSKSTPKATPAEVAAEMFADADAEATPEEDAEPKDETPTE